MKKIIALLFILTIAQLGNAQEEQVLLPPEIKIDDSWTYQGTNTVAPGPHIYVIEVTHVNENAIHTVTTITEGKNIDSIRDGKEIDSTWTKEWNAISTHTGRFFSPHTGVFQFPLSVGKNHEIKLEIFDRRKGHRYTCEARGAVVGWETVEVPAGQFRALKVVQRNLWQRQDTNTERPFELEITYWYVPGVKRWVKLALINRSTQGTLGEELISYVHH